METRISFNIHCRWDTCQAQCRLSASAYVIGLYFVLLSLSLGPRYQVAPRQEQESDDEDDEEGSLEEVEGEEDNEKDADDKKTEKEKKREEYGKDEEDIAAAEYVVLTCIPKCSCFL